jgi:hypothetical protein
MRPGGFVLKLLERKIASVGDRLILLAPFQASPPSSLKNVAVDFDAHCALVREVQRLRGRVYSSDGAVSLDRLAPGGLHQTPDDLDAWHVLVLNQAGRVTGCMFYIDRSGSTPADLMRVRKCPLSRHEQWRGTLKTALEADVRRARRSNLQYAEVGGWAVDEECRGTGEALILALAAYSFAQLCGGAIGITTATLRHCSASILRKLGLERIEADGVTLPEYYDPQYGCAMELLRFDSRRSNARYTGIIDRLGESLQNARVVCAAGEWKAEKVA